ncbi:hypothetical protein E4U41_004652, partial [Claviceps citrina]
MDLGPVMQPRGASFLNMSALPECANRTATLCDEPVRDQAPEFKALNLSLSVLVLLTVVLRLSFKRFYSPARRLGAEDWTILAATVLALATGAVQVLFLVPSGLGRDVWTLDVAHLVVFGRAFYSMEILYLTLITLVKVCLSLFYLGVFPGRGIRRLLWITVGFHIAFGMAFILKTVLQCRPVGFNWERFDGGPASRGRCIDIHASGQANGVLGVVADVWLLALPLTQVHKLRLHWKKKVGAAVMFLTGGIVTIVSMLRLGAFTHFANSYNPTFDDGRIVFWSTIEVCVGLICCCLPTMRLILVRVCPRVFETQTSRMRKSATCSSSNAVKSATTLPGPAECDELKHHHRAAAGVDSQRQRHWASNM